MQSCVHLKTPGVSPILIDPAKDLMVNSPQVLSRASHAKEYVHDVKLTTSKRPLRDLGWSSDLRREIGIFKFLKYHLKKL